MIANDARRIVYGCRFVHDVGGLKLDTDLLARFGRGFVCEDMP